MVNRRIFLKYTGAFALGSLLLPACNSQENKIGLQLYSVKDIIEKDLKGTLQQLAAMGYKEIESYPGQKGHYFGLSPQDFKTMLNDMGLTLVSIHFPSGSPDGKKVDSWHQASMLQSFDQLVEKATQTGQKYLTVSSLSEGLRKTPDDLKRTAELFNKSGETCKKAGLQFAYHNHAFEFEKVGDKLMYDYLLENTDPELVKYEMDIFWLVAGGHDPAAYFTKYPNRFPMGHVKDMDKQDKKKNTEIGTGSIDYATILKAGKDNGMQHFFIEQETFTRSSIESMKMNYDNLSKLSV